MNLLSVIITIILVFLTLLLVWRRSYKTLITMVLLSTAGLGYFKYYYHEAKGIVTVAISPDYMPYAYMKGDKIKGIEIDLLEEIIEHGMKKKLVLKPVGWNFLLTTDADIIAGGLSATENREFSISKQSPHLCFSSSYAPAATAIVTRPSIKLNSDFKGTIIVQAGSVFVEIAELRFPNAKIILRDDFNLAVEELKSGKVDGIIADALALLHIFQQDLQDGYVIYKVKHKMSRDSAKYTAFIINSHKIDPEEFNTLLMIAQQKITNSLYKKLIKKLLALETI